MLRRTLLSTSAARDSRRARAALALVALVALGAAIVVYRTAWISDDAIITFRYVTNLRHGHGAVFNPGERVQGYTHPLWFAVLTIASVLTGDEAIASIALGVAATFASVLLLGWGLLKIARDPAMGVAAFALVVVVLASSDSWRAFQTSGLEGCLSTFFMIAFVTSMLEDRRRPWVVLASGALLVLCRPDFAIVATPAGTLMLLEARRERLLRSALLALTPLLGFVLARVYYGDFLPNTGAAKLGIFTPSEGIRQGLRYLSDLVINEPITTTTAFGLLFFAGARARRRPELALGFGLLGYLAYLVFIGGDFMRGRLLVPLLVGSVTFGGVALTRNVRIGWRVASVAGVPTALALLALAAHHFTPPQTRDVRQGIVNERVFYLPGHSFAAYLTSRRLAGNEDFEILSAYLERCGDVTVHSTNPGALGYYLGPRLTVIDTLGLTDRFIARLPRTNIIEPPPRPGHPYKEIPRSYLARRGDIAILPHWQDDVKKLDCAMRERLRPLESDDTLIRAY